MKRILTINPGSTSTKVAIFHASDSRSVSEKLSETIVHASSRLMNHPDSAEELAIRTEAVESFLRNAGNPEFDAVAGRGGLTRPVDTGSYKIGEDLINDLLSARYGFHASNFGALIAEKLGRSRKIPSLIADPVGVDQFTALARYSGHPDMPRTSQLHALNIRAVAREAACDLGGDIHDFNFVIAHLGGGISVAPMQKGRLVDVNHAINGGPFSPQRCGTLPVIPLVEMCFSGRWDSASEAKNELLRHSGCLAYLGTDDGKEIERRAINGDKKFLEVYQAMAYQISKEIGAMATVLNGDVDAILITGGLPHPPLSDWITERTEWIAPVRIYAGEREMQALALAAARFLFGDEKLKDY